MDTAKHGFRQEVEIENPASPGTYIDVTEKCHNAAIAFPRDGIDTSTFGQGDKTNMNGMRDGTLSIDYYMDASLRALLWGIYESDDPVSIRYYPEGNSGGKERLTADFNMTSFGDGGNIGSAVGGGAQFQRTGATTRDTV